MFSLHSEQRAPNQSPKLVGRLILFQEMTYIQSIIIPYRLQRVFGMHQPHPTHPIAMGVCVCVCVCVIKGSCDNGRQREEAAKGTTNYR